MAHQNEGTHAKSHGYVKGSYVEKEYVHQEYPKVLYRGDQSLIVEDKKSEDLAREDGFKMAVEPEVESSEESPSTEE